MKLRTQAVAALVATVLGSTLLAGLSAPAQALTVPGTPTVTVDGETASVSWTPVADPTIATYRVQISVNGRPFGLAGDTDNATSALQVDDLRSPAFGCPPGPCSVVARVESLDAVGNESGYSAASSPAAIPVPYTFPMSVVRHSSPTQVTLVLYGLAPRAGVPMHLYMLSSEHIWEDTGRITTTRLRLVPGRTHPVRAWLFKVVVRRHGLSNYRVETPATGQVGEGWSRPYGVRR